MTHRWIGRPVPESTVDGAHMVLSGMAAAVREVVTEFDRDAEFQARLLGDAAGAYAMERILAAMERVQRAYRWDRLNTRRSLNRLARCRELDLAVDLIADQHAMRLDLIDDSTGRNLITAVAIECPPDMVRQIREDR